MPVIFQLSSSTVCFKMSSLHLGAHFSVLWSIFRPLESNHFQETRVSNKMDITIEGATNKYCSTACSGAVVQCRYILHYSLQWCSCAMSLHTALQLAVVQWCSGAMSLQNALQLADGSNYSDFTVLLLRD
jgi:hypothetical protein